MGKAPVENATLVHSRELPRFKSEWWSLKTYQELLYGNGLVRKAAKDPTLQIEITFDNWPIHPKIKELCDRKVHVSQRIYQRSSDGMWMAELDLGKGTVKLEEPYDDYASDMLITQVMLVAG